MTEPENALTKQYQALVAAEGAELKFTPRDCRGGAGCLHGERPDGEYRCPAAPHRDGRADGGRPVRAAGLPEKQIVFDAENVRERLVESLATTTYVGISYDPAPARSPFPRPSSGRMSG